jgi:hypothetical protein
MHVFLTSALVGGEWSASRPGRFTPGESAPVTHWIEGWVDPRTGLDDVERKQIFSLPGLELRPLVHICSRATSEPMRQTKQEEKHLYSIGVTEG